MWGGLKVRQCSGAGETVVGEAELESVDIVDGDARRRGVKYEVADGTLIPNLGEKRFRAVTEEGYEKGIVAQVCGVSKSLLSVRRVVENGGTVVFKIGEGYIDGANGDRIWMKERDGVYTLKLWVRKGEKGGFKRLCSRT